MLKLLLLALLAFPLSGLAQVVELSCPAGTQQAQGIRTFDYATGDYRFPVCVDNTGNFTFQSAFTYGVGPAVTSAGLDVSSTTGRVNGLSVNLQQASGTSVTGLRGTDSRVSDASTSAEVVGVQGLGTKTAGASAANGLELWGGNFIGNITGGSTSNVYGAYGEADVGASATVSNVGGGAFALINGLQGYAHANASATLTNAFTAGVVGIAGQQSGDAKGTAAIFAILEGRTNQATTGVGALYKGGNFNTQVNPDFGLDFDTTLNSVALAFNTADIRGAKATTLKDTGNGFASSKNLQVAVTTFASLPACASGTEGSQEAVSDSTVNTWGTAIAGGGTNHVLAYCDGTAWTVAAK